MPSEVDKWFVFSDVNGEVKLDSMRLLFKYTDYCISYHVDSSLLFMLAMENNRKISSFVREVLRNV